MRQYKELAMKTRILVTALAVCLLGAPLISCTSMSKTEQGGLSGAALGAAAGAGISALAGGKAGVGAVVGGVLGGVTGAIYGHNQGK